MKKLTLILSIFLIASVYSLADLQAQNLIPSNDIILTQNSLTFVEDNGQGTCSLEERKMNVKVEDNNPDNVIPVIVLIYSTDGTTEFGPYTVYEGTTLEVSIDEREWGLRVDDYLEGCELSVWID